jgi:hypothetical protein
VKREGRPPLSREGVSFRPLRQRSEPICRTFPGVWLAVVSATGVARRRETSRCVALTEMYPRRTRVLRAQATAKPYLQAFRRGPLTDSNRRPPPYHGGSGAVTADTAGHSRARCACNPGALWMSAVIARVRACSVWCTRLVPAACCLIAKPTTSRGGVVWCRSGASPRGRLFSGDLVASAASNARSTSSRLAVALLAKSARVLYSGRLELQTASPGACSFSGLFSAAARGSCCVCGGSAAPPPDATAFTSRRSRCPPWRRRRRRTQSLVRVRVAAAAHR